MNIRSTKQLIADEEANRQSLMNAGEVPAEAEEEGIHHAVYDLADEVDRKIYSD